MLPLQTEVWQIQTNYGIVRKFIGPTPIATVHIEDTINEKREQISGSVGRLFAGNFPLLPRLCMTIVSQVLKSL